MEAVRAALVQHGKTHEIVVQPEAGHGFFCDDRAAFHPVAAAAAWKKTAAWLGEHLPA